MFKHSWLNSDLTLLTAWSSSTVFTGANFFIHQFAQNLSPLAIIGWILTSAFTIIASISSWKLNRAEENERLAEARRNNALAEKLELENEELQKNILQSCDKSSCMYKDFYDNFNPIILNHFGINTANNNII
jgi:hypothetical protein